MRRLLHFLLFGGFLLFSCTSNPYGNTDKSIYFDLDSLLQSQVVVLAEGGYFLVKSGAINQENETRDIVADSAYWANELDIFRIVDINKPGSLNAYEHHQTQEKATFMLKSSEKQKGVIQQSFEFSDDGKLRSFAATFLEDNYLYTNERKYTMHFDEQGVLNSYALVGRQKVMLVSEVTYEIKGKVQPK